MDDKVSKKLNNIINKIHDIQPAAAKNNIQQPDHKNLNYENIKEMCKPENLLLSTTSITSCLFNKNLTSTMNQ